MLLSIFLHLESPLISQTLLQYPNLISWSSPSMYINTHGRSDLQTAAYYWCALLKLCPSILQIFRISSFLPYSSIMVLLLIWDTVISNFTVLIPSWFPPLSRLILNRFTYNGTPSSWSTVLWISFPWDRISPCSPGWSWTHNHLSCVCFHAQLFFYRPLTNAHRETWSCFSMSMKLDFFFLLYISDHLCLFSQCLTIMLWTIPKGVKCQDLLISCNWSQAEEPAASI